MQPMPLSEYLADPCPEPSLDSSTAWTLVTRTPRHAHAEHPRLGDLSDKTSKVMDIGAAAHALFLEDDDSRFDIVKAKDWRTNSAKSQRDQAHAEGRIPLLEDQYDVVCGIAAASRSTLMECVELAGIRDGALVEQVCVWQEGQTWCRGRPDLVSRDGQIILNYKTTEANANPESFGTGMLVHQGYHVQAYHHARGVMVTMGLADLPTYVWLVQEIEPPYAASILGMSPTLLALAESQWTHALDIWQNCLRKNEWPGYPSRVCWIEAKPWDVERWSGRPDQPAVPPEQQGWRAREAAEFDAISRVYEPLS